MMKKLVFLSVLIILFYIDLSYGQSYIRRSDKSSSASIVIWTAHPCSRTGEMAFGNKRYRFDEKGTTMKIELEQGGYYSYEVVTSNWCPGNTGRSLAYGKGKIYIAPNKKYRLRGKREVFYINNKKYTTRLYLQESL